jgi:hypothetical protein
VPYKECLPRGNHFHGKEFGLTERESKGQTLWKRLSQRDNFTRAGPYRHLSATRFKTFLKSPP